MATLFTAALLIQPPHRFGYTWHVNGRAASDSATVRYSAGSRSRWCFRFLMLLASLAASRSLVQAQSRVAPLDAALPEVRGTWLTTTANTAIASPADTAATMRTLREMGFNTVYVECWKDGYTEFPSRVAERYSGVPMKINAATSGDTAIQRDLLSETLIEAHRNQLVYFAWFEYGFMAAERGTRNELRSRRDWIVLDKNGSDVAENGFVWLNPLHPEAQELLIGIVVEAIRKYDLDGVQLDDRIVWPGLEMGYDEYTRRRYKEDTGRDVPEDCRDPKFTAWRQSKVTEVAQRFVREVRAANPNVIVSLAPGPYPWAREKYLCDWVSWAKGPDEARWDEYVPQVYRMNYDSFELSWREQLRCMADAGQPRNLVAGIRLVGDGPDLPKGDADRSAKLVRSTGGKGQVWWFSRGVLDLFQDELRAFYDVRHRGQAPHPLRGLDWRPPPICLAALKDRPGVWRSFAKVPGGNYRLIAKFENAWRELQRVSIPAGMAEFSVDGAPDAVELLVDRSSDVLPRNSTVGRPATE
jgi:uncharacterized lipoprotein YddW (UPF0748 family)